MPKLTLYIDDVQICTGRLVGIINNEECRAAINTHEAGKKIYTSEDMDLEALRRNCAGSRFVITTDDFISNTHERLVFISPVIRYMSYVGSDRNFRCADGKEYSIKRHRAL